MNRVFYEIYRAARKLYDRPKRVEARRIARLRHQRLLEHFGVRGGFVVRGGPFAGMRYLDQASWVGFFPRLLGMYEEELHPVVERAIEARPDTVIDIGCAEGYYAVGLARRLPAARVYAFDIDANARRLCSALSQLNGVQDRVTIGGRCRTDELNALVGPRTLVVSDCEGAELQLLDPERVPALRQSIMLVEIHDFVDPRISATLRQRFAATHDVTMIASNERDPSRYALLSDLEPGDGEFATDEYRGGIMEWAYMEPRGAWPRRAGSAPGA